MKKQYQSIYHIQWELLFPIMLPSSQEIYCWEPKEGIAIFVPEGHVGAIQWIRSCKFLSAKDIFNEEPEKQDASIFPPEEYRIVSHLKGKPTSYVIAELLAGENGGFREARPYTVVNVSLVESDNEMISGNYIEKRAAAVVNNIIETYRCFSLDPLLRTIKPEIDCYYTSTRRADLPQNLRFLSIRDILKEAFKLKYSGGEGTGNGVGINSIEDLTGHRLDERGLELFKIAAQKKLPLEIFHELFLSAIRRLKRGEGALAIIDAQSAFEAGVTGMLRDALIKKGSKEDDLDTAFRSRGELDNLKKRLGKIDVLASEHTNRRFAGSDIEKEWRISLTS